MRPLPASIGAINWYVCQESRFRLAPLQVLWSHFLSDKSTKTSNGGVRSCISGILQPQQKASVSCRKHIFGTQVIAHGLTYVIGAVKRVSRHQQNAERKTKACLVGSLSSPKKASMTREAGHSDMQTRAKSISTFIPRVLNIISNACQINAD